MSELIGLRCADVHLGTGAHVRCHGKGRKERIRYPRWGKTKLVVLLRRDVHGVSGMTVWARTRW